jgi:hypothetical protein
MAEVVERVVYIDALGKEWQARTLERPKPGEPTKLLVKLGPTLQVMTARHSDGREPATWHRLPEPS